MDPPTLQQMGIIPAYAGNTVCLPLYSPCLRDHPRVCGEHSGMAVNLLRPSGSSPRMRGTPCGNGNYRPQAGIIPAYAGNTPENIGFRTGTKDHPRVCGEHGAAASASPLV